MSGHGPAAPRAALPAVLALAALAALPAAAAAQEGGGPGTDVGGGVYLYHYAPVDLEGVDDRTEIYAAFLTVDHTSGPWSFHAEGRWRDTKLREFYPSTAWIQEAWAAVRLPLAGAGGGGRAGGSPGEPASPGPRPELTLRAGKIYTRLGRFWDGSFFGNLHYFDGLKLDPDFGAEAVLDLPVGPGALEVRGQYLSDGDRINGALEGRDLEGLEAGGEEGGPLGAVHLEVPLLGPGAGGAEGEGDRVRLRVGASGFLERGRVDGGEAELGHVALDAGLTAWGHEVYAEYTDRGADGVPASAAAGPAGSAAQYWLVGARLHFAPLHLRYNYSRAEYAGAGFDERIHQPGVTLDLRDWLHAILEYDGWVRSAGASGGTTRLDRSLNLVLLADL